MESEFTEFLESICVTAFSPLSVLLAEHCSDEATSQSQAPQVAAMVSGQADCVGWSSGCSRSGRLIGVSLVDFQTPQTLADWMNPEAAKGLAWLLILMRWFLCGSPIIQLSGCIVSVPHIGVSTLAHS